MKFRTTLLAAAIAALASTAAFADNFVGGEQGYENHPAASEMTRDQAQREYRAFRQHPVLWDGAVMMQGEAGYVSPVHGTTADRAPARPHSHVMGNSGSASPRMQAPVSEAERRALREQHMN